MRKICIFAGTTEGKNLVNYLFNKPCDLTVCVATEYGEISLDQKKIKTKVGRMDALEIEELFIKEKFDIVVDATHPFAQLVTDNIEKSCKKTDIAYVRINRNTNLQKGFKDTQAAIEYLKTTEGNILLTTGSKEIINYSAIANFSKRVYARVLPVQDSIEKCVQAGLDAAHIIAMQGPFTKELNTAMLKSYNIKILVTKNTGAEGGFDEKLLSAIETGTECVVINPPEQKSGYFYNEAIEVINKEIGTNAKQKISIVGMGTGNKNHMTQQAIDCIKNCDVIIGAKRLTDSCIEYSKPSYNTFSADEIIKIATTNTSYKNIAVVMSGDIGFYSGAKNLYSALTDYEIETIPGISTPVYFASRLKLPWQDTKLLSLHARKANLIHYVKTNKTVFTLVGGDDGVKELCEVLCEYNLCELQLYIGENLGYDCEKITKGTPSEIKNMQFDTLSAVIIENKAFTKVNRIGISDQEFFRLDKVPMTKSEVRAVSISKLQLSRDSVIYDIGAGTGSVSVECAINAYDGVVYAIEKDADAVEVIEKNKYEFALQNLKIINGFAPNALENLEKPTHAFLGGTGGNIKEIFGLLLDKNPEVRIVVNTIALESLSQVLEVISCFDLQDVEIININVSKSKKLGNYNMMLANNPIYIISCQRRGK